MNVSSLLLAIWLLTKSLFLSLQEVKFSPLSGFALLKAKEDGIKIQRLRLMLRQFVAYMFYLLLVMALCYTNFTQHTYNMSQAVERSFVTPTMPNSNKSFKNISRYNAALSLYICNVLLVNQLLFLKLLKR